jgi:flagellar protein FlgJ
MLNNVNAIGPEQPDPATGEDKVAPAVDTAAALDKAYVAKATKAAV